MTPSTKRWLVHAVKLLLTATILYFVGIQFYQLLPGIQDVVWHWDWLVASMALFAVGVVCNGAFWYLLLARYGHRPRFFTVIRAYFIGNLGKYVPGKALTLIMRAGLVRGSGVPLSLAVLTSFYEVFTVMASGALLAAVVLALDPPPVAQRMQIPPALSGLLLLGLCGIPLMPPVFNFVVGRAARRFQSDGAKPAIQIDLGVLLQGIGVTLLGWLALGLALWTGLNAVQTEPIPWSFATWLHHSAILSLAWVAGFMALFLPGGIGLREWLLLEMLQPYGPASEIAAGVVLVRLAWTVAEVGISALLYPMATERFARDDDQVNEA